MFKVAPSVYEDLYGDEEPPKDESIPGNEQKITPGKDGMEFPIDAAPHGSHHVPAETT